MLLEKTYSDISELYDLFDRAIDEDAPLTISDEILFVRDITRHSIRIAAMMKHGKKWIAALQQQERVSNRASVH